MKMEINKGVALTSMINYLEANIPQVGQVIVKFLIFKELGWLCGVDSEKAVKLFEDIIRPAMAAGVGINLLSERNRETYVSPFDTPVFNPDYGLEVSDVTTDRIGEWLRRAALCTGEISDLEAIAADGEFAARFYSEKSIDSAKKLIMLPYTAFIDSLPSILMGREKEDYQFNCKVNWKSKGKVKSTQKKNGCFFNFEDRVEYHYMIQSFAKKDGAKIPKIWDQFQDIRVAQLPDIAAYALRLSKVEQVMPKELFDICHAAGNSKSGQMAKELFGMVIDMYRTATSSRTDTIEMARQEIKNLPMKLSDREQQQLLKEVKEVISDLYNEVYAALTSMLRRISAKVSPVDRCSIMVDLIAEEAKKKNDEPSFKILSDLLPEEYVAWAIDMSHRFGWDVCDYVEEPIDNINMEEGDIVNFDKGIATYVDNAGVQRTAVADDIDFSGDSWTIAFNETDGRWVARKPIVEFLAPAEPEDVVCFLTKSYKVEAKPIFEKLKEEYLGHEVRLGFGDMGHYFFVDQKPVAKWKNWSEDNELGESGKTFRVKEAFYSKYNRGILKDVIISDYPADKKSDEKKFFRAFVIMEKPQVRDNGSVKHVAPMVNDSLVAKSK